MKTYVGKRILQLIPMLLGITILSFGLMHISSTDAVDMIEVNTGTVMSESEKEQKRAELGLDQSIPEQYVHWMSNMLRGDMGTSYLSGKPVLDTLLSKLPATLKLTAASILLTIVVSIPLGILAAIKKDTSMDFLIRCFCFLGNSLPNFFVALLLIYFLSVKAGWFPVTGNMKDWKSLILPTLTLALAMSSKYIRQVRAAVLDELQKDYVLGARARGITERKILYKSVLKSAMLTILTVLALSIGSLLGGTAIVESIFMWDGIGKMAVDAVMMRDYPVIQAYVIWMAVIYGLINLLTDLLYHYLDPRVRIGQEERV